MMRRIGLVPLVLLLLIGLGHGAEEVISKITILGNAKVESGVIGGH